MTFAYYLIHNWSGKCFILIQSYQGSDEFLLCQFGKIKVLKGRYVVQVTSWGVRNLPHFKSRQDDPNEVEQKGLAQNKKNLMNYIVTKYEVDQKEISYLD